MNLSLTIERALAKAGVSATDMLLAGVSGGADSMALLYALHVLGRPFQVVHVEHGLRGEHSLGDAKFVRDICATLGIRFHLIEVDAAAEAKRRGSGMQEAARHLRYAAFSRLASLHDGAVLTAHHGDDQLETRLLHMLRGGTLAGLAGMQMRSDERGFPLLRPLLETPQKDLIGSLREAGHSWREDASNADPHYLRSRVRHELLPLLRDLQPGFEGPFGRLAERAAEVNKALDRQFAPQLQHLEAEGKMPVSAFEDSPTPRLLADAVVLQMQLDVKHVGALLDLTQRAPGSAFETSAHRVVREIDTLAFIVLDPARALEKVQAPDCLLDREGTSPQLAWSTAEPVRPLAIDPDRHTAQLDADTLSWPLTLRPWRAGDRLQPIGMEGTKKVSDLLNQRKRTADERIKTLVLESDGQIAWVLGERIAAPFAMTANTLRVITFTTLGKENSDAVTPDNVSCNRI